MTTVSYSLGLKSLRRNNALVSEPGHFFIVILSRIVDDPFIEEL